MVSSCKCAIGGRHLFVVSLSVLRRLKCSLPGPEYQGVCRDPGAYLFEECWCIGKATLALLGAYVIYRDQKDAARELQQAV